ncbi:hypothetical protein E2562_028368 [Oryza meyeriana var. granulata]|uniref:Uncharacterized protein n=1 Tax=Oryza meyeriana var. granulata TaxID=110450 RepID=A0A6G1CUA1_9ORYZ|nr:hypothetical protein E2562_028368 [Oryza meyeriana var. granulata]
MAPSFGRSISFPLSPARSKPRAAAACHVRSISLPCRSHPLLSHLQSHIAAVRSWLVQDASSVSAGLAHIHALHAALADLLLLPDPQDTPRTASSTPTRASRRQSSTSGRTSPRRWPCCGGATPRGSPPPSGPSAGPRRSSPTSPPPSPPALPPSTLRASVSAPRRGDRDGRRAHGRRHRQCRGVRGRVLGCRVHVIGCGILLQEDADICGLCQESLAGDDRGSAR